MNIIATNEKEDQEDDEPTQQEVLKDMVSILTPAKIIVVAQSDEYGDNDNRLMEALTSGALVMMDITILTPTIGLVNTTNIIYDELTNLLDWLVRYYLQHASKRHAIARRGQNFESNLSHPGVPGIFFVRDVMPTPTIPATPMTAAKNPKYRTFCGHSKLGVMGLVLLFGEVACMFTASI